VAWPLWARIKKVIADKGWNSLELQERTGIARQTVGNLEVSTRAPQARIVNQIADALGIDRYEAHQLAGLVPDEGITVRAAIESSTLFSDTQKQALLAKIADFETENRATQP